MQIFNIETGKFKADGGTMFGVVPKQLWQKKYEADEHNLCSIADRAMLIDTGDRKVLVDTGIGNKQDEKFLAFHYLHGDDTLEKSLNAQGFKPEDITDIILTHLHWDHCGGVLNKNSDGEIVAAFPNAQIWVSQMQWDWATNPNIREAPAFPQENIRPMQETNKVNLVKQEGEIIPGIEVRLFNGHTKGLMLPLIDKGGKKVFFAGDLIPVMANIPLVYVASYDILPLDTIAEKERILQEALENNWTIVLQHDVSVEACTVKDTPKGIREDQLLKIAEI
ncbi:MAG TPA: MBL fold metallo-hydrolase [Salinivirga sp.]|uniref:MBL fold metallo-hydrolase n=1 Tax=Salinivirga sp. TaxID=1970192 RepID=UPI002B480AFE|nr:MBL fold metallo-hydrolase [Salinivirga sp.]HKK59145.1 MBL fold metallo-hydrolase [Salinivirga sp.]